jgi:hypothetical protein
MLAGAFVQMLEEEGVRVAEWTRPEERRGLGDIAQGVLVEIISNGALVAIGIAIERFRRRFPGGGDVDVQELDPEED